MARTIVIGDVHGCADELERLLGRLVLRRSDEIVFVGDLVNKGPGSIEVVRIARELGARAVLGNHDDLVLRACRARRSAAGDEEYAPGVRKIARSLEPEDEAWLRALPLFLRLPEHRAVVVHGGMLPGRRPEDQRREHLLTMRSVREDGSASKRIDEGEPWGALWNGRTHAIFGHDAIRGIQRHERATGLDTGCVYGGRLSALILPDFEIVSVAARREYTAPGGKLSAALAPHREARKHRKRLAKRRSKAQRKAARRRERARMRRTGG